MNTALEGIFKCIAEEFQRGGGNDEIGDIIKQRLRKAITTGRDQYLNSRTRSYLNEKYECDELGEQWAILRKDSQRMRLKGATKKANDRNQLFIWLTINPNPTIKLEAFMKLVEKFANRAMFKQYAYVIEQRGTIEELNIGTGFHAHLLLQRSLTYKPNKVLANSKNTFKYMCDTTKQHLFNFHWCPSLWIDDKLEYMRFGKKTGDGKLEKQEADILFREENDLLEYYPATAWKKNIDL